MSALLWIIGYLVGVVVVACVGAVIYPPVPEGGSGEVAIAAIVWPVAVPVALLTFGMIGLVALGMRAGDAVRRRWA